MNYFMENPWVKDLKLIETKLDFISVKNVLEFL